MTYEEIIAKSNEFLVDEFEVDGSKITPQANLRETLELDSLDYIDLVVVIESNFGVKVKAEEFGEIITFKDFYDYINKKLSLKNV
ncbi:MAG: acyl carrier protein [Saprospiraceae bacterium]|jgi:acyl carrier protein|uniref:Acyl carrier protein n=1 Tax=Candidatus Defluviibacterium haderslevense TaxID=2981993 RepID=A0A9D7S6R4_9BACT|nr:acyl carrier protein [Candidatus Defluviibacterium haderslevense]MBK9716414.1 acyl carrier protein [Candidatus Defluviibacterium haderslevense]MBL0238759.1 acyl carrier protein [Candidatus Defluviibacterium haderslevense]MCI1265510.1 acyl carrier protein [Saprospiraceae bacterium]